MRRDGVCIRAASSEKSIPHQRKTVMRTQVAIKPELAWLPYFPEAKNRWLS